MPAESSTQLVILAKRPKLGAVKTRLAADTGPVEALAIYQQLLQLQIDHARRYARAAPHRHVRIDWDAPSANGSRTVEERGWLVDGKQGAGSIGDRMGLVMGQHFSSERRAGDRLIIVGSDCPYLDEQVLAAAEAALDEVDCALVPALDGGYVLIGVNRHFMTSGCDVFGGMPWSTPELMAATRERLSQAGVRWAELPPLEDIDEWPALQRWQAAATDTSPSAS
ncbi:TIGR04282 family arsenosugar biosynthesis glycosyltransferase [Allohahella marinimesophila]|uniref:TIGR04282 family arsenosugar biosynthesis glycosyltransferase n=1 Tax=Allohahella marinimesophila TaxID=1054972 RepID=A0ABP7NU32_9GAMM